MHSHGIQKQRPARHLSHLNFLFTGQRTRIYDKTMVQVTRKLYQRVVKDMLALQRIQGKVLDVGTGPGTLVREIARSFPQLQVYGVDLSEEMIRLAQQHARQEHLEKQVHFEVGDVAHLSYPDASFEMIVSTISMHHWYDLSKPLQELYRVLQPGGRLWIYDFRFMQPATIEKALVNTAFAGSWLEHHTIRTGLWPFAIYRRFALQRSN